MRKPKPQAVINGNLEEFDSEDEVLMAMWLEEAKSAGDVLDWKRVVDKHELFPATRARFLVPTGEACNALKVKPRTAFGAASYGEDFVAVFRPDILRDYPGLAGVILIGEEGGSLCSPLGQSPDGWTHIDIKPPRAEGKVIQIAILRMKILFDKTGIYTHAVLVDELFMATYAPSRAVWRKDGKGRYARYKHCRLRSDPLTPGGKGLKMDVGDLLKGMGDE